jgi:hypothetical protein
LRFDYGEPKEVFEDQVKNCDVEKVEIDPEELN